MACDRRKVPSNRPPYFSYTSTLRLIAGGRAAPASKWTHPKISAHPQRCAAPSNNGLRKGIFRDYHGTQSYAFLSLLTSLVGGSTANAWEMPGDTTARSLKKTEVNIPTNIILKNI